MRSHKEIAEEILGYPIGEDGCAPCPGAALHTAQSGPRDWRIWFDGEGKPHEYCFHNSCQGARDDFMRTLYRAISDEERGTRGTRKPVPKYQRPLPAAPKAQKVKPEDLNEDLAAALAARVEESITFDWLRAHSPVEIPDNPRAWGGIAPEGALSVRIPDFGVHGVCFPGSIFIRGGGRRLQAGPQAGH